MSELVGCLEDGVGDGNGGLHWQSIPQVILEDNGRTSSGSSWMLASRLEEGLRPYPPVGLRQRLHVLLIESQLLDFI
jgi:hypothetical protein